MKGGYLYLFLTLSSFLVSSFGQKQCPLAPAYPEDRREDKSQLTIATYNVEWLFVNRSNCPGVGCAWHTEGEALKHMQAVADEIRVINADILNLAEVQDCGVLHQLNLLLVGMRYVPYLLTGTDTSTGQNVALLTRVDPSVNLQRTAARVKYPIPGSTCGSTYSGDSAVSKHYFTTFNIEGLSKPLSIFGMHFLAFPDDPMRCVQREAQASVMRSLIAEAIQAGHSVVALGDMNDFDGTIVDASKSVPISQVLHLLRNPTLGEELVNVVTYVPWAHERYSCWYDRNGDCQEGENELTLIDHLLISSDLAPLVTKAYVDHTYGVSCDTYDSDHWPIVVHLGL
jgi:exonuclease III